jgi:glycosyltransferase involved in cell wall biosynthesis
MKILFVSLFLPQRQAYHAGGRYVYELLRQLANRHELHLATRLEEGEFPSLEELRPLCRAIHPFPYRTKARRGVLDKVRLLCNYISFSRFADRLIRTGNYDLVQVEWVETALLIRRRGVPLVLDAHDVLSKPAERVYRQARGFGRIVAGLRAWLTRRLERAIVRRFDLVLTLSDFDRQYLGRLAPEVRTRTVPIPAGLDLTDREYPREAATILFLASYKYRPVNVAAALWFAREVLPLVRRSFPAVRFVAAGYGPPPELTELAHRDPGIEVPGFVDDTDALYKRAAVFVAPILTGGGIIVKVLDALAAGTPVVTTTFGNEGVGAKPGRDLLVADDPEDFAAAVVRLLADRNLADRLGASGRSLVAERYGLASVIARLEAAYGELAAGEGRGETGENAGMRG